MSWTALKQPRKYTAWIETFGSTVVQGGWLTQQRRENKRVDIHVARGLYQGNIGGVGE